MCSYRKSRQDHVFSGLACVFKFYILQVLLLRILHLVSFTFCQSYLLLALFLGIVIRAIHQNMFKLQVMFTVGSIKFTVYCCCKAHNAYWNDKLNLCICSMSQIGPSTLWQYPIIRQAAMRWQRQQAAMAKSLSIFDILLSFLF